MSTTSGWGAALRGCGVGIACRRGVRGTGIPAGSAAVDGATALAAGRRRARVAGTELADDGPAAVGVAEAAVAGVAGFARARVAGVTVAGLVGAGAAGLVRARAAGVAVLAGCLRARATGFAAGGVAGTLRARVTGVARAAVAGLEGAGVAGFRARAAVVPLGEVAGAAAPAAVARFEVAREREVFVAPGVDSVFTVDGFVDLRRGALVLEEVPASDRADRAGARRRGGSAGGVAGAEVRGARRAGGTRPVFRTGVAAQTMVGACLIGRHAGQC